MRSFVGALLVVVAGCASARGPGNGGDDGEGGDGGADGDDVDAGDRVEDGDAGTTPDVDAAAVPACAPSAWMVEDIGPARGLTGQIVVDGDGALHVAYIGPVDKLVHASKPVGGTWIRSTFREGQSFDDAMAFSIAVADDRTVHVAYTSEVGNNFPHNGWRLRHASRAPGAGWSEREYGTYYRVTNPVVAAGSEVHVFYSESGYLHDDDLSGTQRRYLYPYGQAVSAVVRDGRVHVGLRRYLAGESMAPAVHGELAPGSSFTFETFGTNGTAPALALAPSGAVHLVYHDEADQQVRHATRAPGGSWQVETVSMARYVSPSLAVDRAGRVHAIISIDGTANAYTVRSAGGVWSPPTMLPLVGPALAVGPDDVVHIVGRDATAMRHMWGCPP